MNNLTTETISMPSHHPLVMGDIYDYMQTEYFDYQKQIIYFIGTGVPIFLVWLIKWSIEIIIGVSGG